MWSPLAVAAAAGAAGSSTPRPARTLTVVPPALYAGTNRADTLNGTSANDVLRGRGGNDTLHGRGGNDLVDGGPATIAPTATPVATTSSAASGTIVLGDGRRDTLNGGPGFDEAWVDRRDVVRNVERVHRPE